VKYTLWVGAVETCRPSVIELCILSLRDTTVWTRLLGAYESDKWGEHNTNQLESLSGDVKASSDIGQ